ncbi:nuclear transport factor 2 family protein [Kitasatospora sp. LaBMicrA B282]|uniref:nuclear transport factor 2 family protein n=1 Tax=Kitasatospora sp. LaBMicrA B282 TaxID=3420949 RepID=UPI003D14550C
MADTISGQGSEIREFAQQWFDLLSRHDPVEDLLPLVVDEGLEMAFPERTLRSHADFRDWYTVVGEAFDDQSHVLEQFTAREQDGRVDIELTVVWAAKHLAEGTRAAFRVQQSWQLTREPATGALRISHYQVGTLTPVPDAA